jgi:DNA-directed RNA polymerase beta' subunit
MTTSQNTNVKTVYGVLCYTKIAQPAKKYQSDELEWSLDIVVSEDEADVWDENYKKQPSKAVKTSEFKEIFKIDPPFPEQRKQHVIKLKRGVAYKDGTPIPDKFKPKVFIDRGNGIENITDTLVANGSTGWVSYEESENSYGRFVRLRAVKVDNLIEYTQTGSGGVDNDFGTPVVAGQEDFAEAPAKPVAAKKTTRKPVEEEQGEESPF